MGLPSPTRTIKLALRWGRVCPGLTKLILEHYETISSGPFHNYLQLLDCKFIFESIFACELSSSRPSAAFVAVSPHDGTMDSSLITRLVKRAMSITVKVDIVLPLGIVQRNNLYWYARLRFEAVTKSLSTLSLVKP